MSRTQFNTAKKRMNREKMRSIIDNKTDYRIVRQYVENENSGNSLNLMVSSPYEGNLKRFNDMH